MKITRSDAHDRYSYYKNQDFDIAMCCQNLIDQRPFGDHAFYIFAHARTLGLTKRLSSILWQIRNSQQSTGEDSNMAA